MHKRLIVLLVILPMTGCGTKPAPQVSNTEEPKLPPQVEIHIGGQEDPEHGRLLFTITAVQEKQKPSMEAPFHVQGGEWTYFDCQALNNANVAFSVGVLSKS